MPKRVAAVPGTRSVPRVTDTAALLAAYDDQLRTDAETPSTQPWCLVVPSGLPLDMPDLAIGSEVRNGDRDEISDARCVGAAEVAVGHEPRT